MFPYYWHNKCFQVLSQSHPFCLQGSVDQRLKWAVGANPGLQEVWTLLLSSSYILIWCKSLNVLSGGPYLMQVIIIRWLTKLQESKPPLWRQSSNLGSWWSLSPAQGRLACRWKIYCLKIFLLVFVFQQFEALRTSTPEARASDHQFLGILSLCRSSQSTWNSTAA